MTSSNCFDLHGKPLDRPTATFDDIVGHEGAKEDLLDVVRTLKDPSKLKAIGGHLRRGLILNSPSGICKTSLAKALANATDCAFIPVSCAQLVGKEDERDAEENNQVDFSLFDLIRESRKQDVPSEDRSSAQKIRELFNTARARAPCIIFMDELDFLCSSKVAIGEMLTQMDGFVERSKDQVFVLAATNKIQKIDTRLSRSGRFDHVISLIHPSEKERFQLFKQKSAKMQLDEKTCTTKFFHQMAELTIGFTGADIQSLLQESAILTQRKGLEKITAQMVKDALDRQIGGYETTIEQDSHETKIVAVHEAGHALVSMLLEFAEKKDGFIPHELCLKASIVKRQNMNGAMFTRVDPNRGRSFQSLKDKICVLFGGTMAEAVVFGDNGRTTGCEIDMGQIMTILDTMSNAQMFLKHVCDSRFKHGNVDSAKWKPFGKFLDGLRAKTRKLLEANKPLLLVISAELEKTKVVERERLLELICAK